MVSMTNTYGEDFTRAQALTEQQYANAHPNTVRAAWRKYRQSERTGTMDGTMATLVDIAHRRGIRLATTAHNGDVLCPDCGGIGIGSCVCCICMTEDDGTGTEVVVTPSSSCSVHAWQVEA